MSELDQGFADRAEGITANIAANQRGHSNHSARVENAIKALAASGNLFNANTLEALVLMDGEGDFDRRLLASFIGQWALRGRIVEEFDQRPARSLRRSRRGGLVRWWRGAPIPEQRRAEA